MKICPQCRQKYTDDSLNYCLNDGVKLESVGSEPETLIRPANLPTAPASPFETVPSAKQTTVSDVPQFAQVAAPKKSRGWLWTLLIVGGLIILCGGGLIAVVYRFTNNVAKQINSIDFNAVANKYNVNFNSPEDRNSTANAARKSPNANLPEANKPGNDEKTVLTMSKFNKIKTGMSYDDLVKILGTEGDQVSSSEAGGYTTVTYKWAGDNFTYVIITVQNGKVMFKSQANLK